MIVSSGLFVFLLMAMSVFGGDTVTTDVKIGPPNWLGKGLTVEDVDLCFEKEISPAYFGQLPDQISLQEFCATEIGSSYLREWTTNRDKRNAD